MVVAVVFATWIVYRARYAGLRSLLLLSNHFSCIKLNQHGPVCFKLLNGYRQSKIVEEKELKFKVIEFDKRKPSNLGIAGVSIENVGKEFTGTSDTSNNQSMNVETINNEKVGKLVLLVLVQIQR